MKNIQYFSFNYNKTANFKFNTHFYDPKMFWYFNFETTEKRHLCIYELSKVKKTAKPKI